MARFVLAGVAGAIRACGPGHAPRPRGMISAVSCSTVMVVSPLLRMSSAKRGQRKPGQGEGCRSATEKERCHGLHEVAATEWGRGGMGAPIVYSFRLSRHPLSISFCRKCSLSLTRKKNVGERCVMHGVEQQGRCVRKGSERSGVPIVFAALLELRLDRVLQLLGRAHGPRARGGSSSTAEAQKGQRARERRPSRTLHRALRCCERCFFAKSE